MDNAVESIGLLKTERRNGGRGDKLFVLNYCTGLTWLIGTKSQKNPFQVCMSGGWAVSRVETRFQALHDRRVSSSSSCICSR